MHLQKHQRWRHRVRGRNSKVLPKLELAKELPRFFHAELVDIGEPLPFDDDFLKGDTTALVTPDSRAETQLCIVADYILRHGDIHLLCNLWSRIGSFTNHQPTFCDFEQSDFVFFRIGLIGCISFSDVTMYLFVVSLCCVVDALCVNRVVM